jgi:glucosamine-6-phosphate deaminase
MRGLLGSREQIAMMFASAASQRELLAGLAYARIDWARVVAYHLDEYIGIPSDSPQNFAEFLRRNLFSQAGPKVFHTLDGNAPDLAAECERYSRLLAETPLDIACLGIGENGHLAFNDPSVADFADPVRVKVVEIEDVSRRQQVRDGAFDRLESVPKTALTVTLPSLTAARQVFCVVPTNAKSQAVHDTLLGPIATSCPASILRRHPRAILYLDRESASLLPG